MNSCGLYPWLLCLPASGWVQPLGPLGGGRKWGAELGFSIYSRVFALDWMWLQHRVTAFLQVAVSMWVSTLNSNDYYFLSSLYFFFYFFLFYFIFKLYMHACVLSRIQLFVIWETAAHQTADPSVRGILQTRILEQLAISSFRGSSQPRDRTHISVSCISGQILYHWAT